MEHVCAKESKIDKQDERINKMETTNAMLNTRMDNLTVTIDNLARKMEKFTNATFALIATIVGGVIITVVGGFILALVLYVIKVN